MEGTFASAKNQFKLNYIQHFLTGEEKYKGAYEAAKQTMDSILDKAPELEPQASLKETHERSHVKLHQNYQTTSIPTQGWKYWMLGLLSLSIVVLSNV